MKLKEYIKPLAEIESIEYDGDVLQSASQPAPPEEIEEEPEEDAGDSFLNGAKGYHSFNCSFDEDDY